MRPVQGRKPNDAYRVREHLTEDEVDRLLAALKANRHGHRDWLIGLLIYRHGLRECVTPRCRRSLSRIFGGANDRLVLRGPGREVTDPSGRHRRGWGPRVRSGEGTGLIFAYSAAAARATVMSVSPVESEIRSS